VADIQKIYLGTTEISKMLLGESLLYEKRVIDTTPPITTPRPTAGTFEAPIDVWLDVNKAATTYYTTDGSTPTTSSTIYSDAIRIEETTQLRFFSVNLDGYAETPKSATYTIAVPSTGYRYVRYQGFGDQTSEATTRLVELEAREGGVTGGNYLRGRTPISGEPVAAGASIAAVTDGVKTMTSGSFPIWWSGAGIPTLVYDLGEERNIDTIKVYMFSTVNDPRQTRFRVWVSKDNSNWVMVADYRNNTAAQSPNGWAFDVPSG
jgi:hypothetical protein